jgi:hypothetical protein
MIDPMGTFGGLASQLAKAGRRASYQAWEARQEAEFKAWDKWARENPRAAASWLAVEDRRREGLPPNWDFHIGRRLAWEVGAKVVTTTGYLAEGAAGGALAATGTPPGIAAGTYLLADAASGIAGEIAGPEADLIGEGYRHYFGDKAGPWVRAGVATVVGEGGAAFGGPRVSVPRRSSAGAWDDFVRLDQALPDNAPLYTGRARDLYMGRTPGRGSPTGRTVVDRAIESGGIVESADGMFVRYYDPQTGAETWHPMQLTDMSHIDDAVSWWNRTGRSLPPDQVRTWMRNPDNYFLEPRGPNRSRGASSGETYLAPDKDR